MNSNIVTTPVFWVFAGYMITEIVLSCNCSGERKNFLVLPDYNKFETPREKESETTFVYVNIDVMEIDQITEEKMEFSMQFYVSEYWKDGRLNSSYLEKHLLKQIPREWVKDLWVPDTIFENSKGGWIYPLSVPNTVVKMRRHGFLHRFTRYNMKISCRMLLHKFPMDSQNCGIKISSPYDNSQVMYRWMRDRPEGTEGIEDFTLADLSPLKYYVANTSTHLDIVKWPTGSYNSLHANLTFVRHLSSHIVNIYIPSGLVVVLSFLTFWLNVRSVPARVALGLTSLLTLSTQASQARSDLPPINYLTALDVWLFVCMMLVFSTLIEFATVYHLYTAKVTSFKTIREERYSPSRIAKPPSGNLFVSRSPVAKGSKKKPQEVKAQQTLASPEFEEDTQLVDKVCRVAFPVTFAVFTAAYWIKYLEIIK